jgi:uncharacterized membrane protein
LPKLDWESLVGVKLFSWIAGIALLLAVVFFLRYSINQGWLMPKVRMSGGSGCLDSFPKELSVTLHS